MNAIIRSQQLVSSIVFDLVLISFSQIYNINSHIIGFYFRQYFAFSVIFNSLIISTVLTFLIGRNRLKYPEKPIIYLNIFYLIVSCGFLLKYIVGNESIACELDGSIKGIISSIRNTTGTSVILCTIKFFLIYYSNMPSLVWWVIIS
jgi:hypothetical protein